MLQLCSDGHEELCHDGCCPACAEIVKRVESDEQCSAALAERDEWKQKVSDLENEIAGMQTDNDQLRSQIDNLQARLDKHE